MAHDLLVPNGPDVDVVEQAVQAEDLGYDSVWLGELWGGDPFTRLAAAATATDSIELGTAIVNVYSRTPAVLAMSAASLDSLSDGRFTLGVGVSTKQAIENIHGQDFDRPVRRAHETIDVVRRLLDGDERVTYDGELLEVSGVPPLDVDVPVYHAALGKANRRVVARLCDGWIPHNVPFPDLEDAFAYVAEIADDAGRDPDDITVAPYVPAVVDEDGEAARDALRGHVAYYVGSGEGYERAVGDRFPDGASAVAEAWRDGDRETARSHVTDEMLAALGVAGTPDEARRQFRTLLDGTPVDRPMVTLPSNASADQHERTIWELAPERFD
ncbi:LLM class flavin-dependent oxidoreductase [Haloarculaceae archaeon H-GB2-1]|nr:LLM class flavin-dependent oxidoreductase [Haloarculaceae archaeon H-GB1-1]MEA5388012.1 LLM class flavin-dependent oxidoreductase [Haloarculaceae archaeon H-GB11]MEA5409499.1 LLM class flavin-dependent oxidoreductase [Haloarculaceae archaeon H-GB2-1]